MATEQGNNGIRPSTLYSFLSTVFVSMIMVLMASNKADDNWYRIVVMVYLVGMQLFFVVMLVIARRAEKQSEAKSKAEPDAGATRESQT